MADVPGFRVFASVEGAKAVENALEQLGESIGRSVVREAVKEAAKPIAEDAGAMAPRGTEPTGSRKRLADSIVVTTRLKRSTRNARFAREGRVKRDVIVHVGPTVPHAHLVEFGHFLVKGSNRKGNRRVIGFVAAHPFMRPAWDKHRDKIAPRIGRFVWVALQKRARRLAGQARRGKLGKKALATLRRNAGR